MQKQEPDQETYRDEVRRGRCGKTITNLFSCRDKEIQDETRKDKAQIVS